MTDARTQKMIDTVRHMGGSPYALRNNERDSGVELNVAKSFGETIREMREAQDMGLRAAAEREAMDLRAALAKTNATPCPSCDGNGGSGKA